MELSEEVKQSYLKFCKVSPENPKNNNDSVRVWVSYDPIENVVRVIEKGCYNYYVSYSKEGLVNEEVYDFIANTYSFQMQDETVLKYIVSRYGYHRQGSYDDGSIGPHDTSSEPEEEEITTYYKVPENFKLEDGLDLTKMEEIKENKSSKTR